MPDEPPKTGAPVAPEPKAPSPSPSAGPAPPPPPSAAARSSKGPAYASYTPPPVPLAGRGGGDDDPMVGAVLLNRVRIIRHIARGGMGKVYYGEQTTMGRPCAVKILDPRLAGNADTAEFARRFLLEASTAAKLTHPNVVTIFDYGETPDGSCFIAMEYLEGRSLSDELKKVGRLDPERAIHVTRQVCRALREAHALGVVHRDMKPGNVFLIQSDDDGDFAKVLDFGLVKETTGPSEQEQHTQIGQIMGSPRYMAPEQVQGKNVDARTDIYSVGAMFFAMLAGKPPFDKATELATMMAQVSDPPPPIASVAPDVVLPPGLEAVVMKCLAKNPDDRFASMEELITALKLQPGALATSSESGGHAAPRLVPPAMTLQGDAAESPRRNMTPIVVVALVVGLALSVALWMRSPAATPAPGAPVSGAAPSALLPAPAPAPKPTATLHVDTDPPGAKVKEEGDTMCETTPCDIVYVGQLADPTYEHLLTFLKADYKLERKIVKVSASPLTVKLVKAPR